MNVLDAAHLTVKRYPGGSESLGPRVGIVPAVLRSKVNPNCTTHRLAVDEADLLMGVTGDFLILQTLAANHGFGLVKLDDVEEGGSVLQTLLRSNAAEGDFDHVLDDALADGVITENEMRLIDAAGARQQAALIVLLQRLRSLQPKAGG